MLLENGLRDDERKYGGVSARLLQRQTIGMEEVLVTGRRWSCFEVCMGEVVDVLY